MKPPRGYTIDDGLNFGYDKSRWFIDATTDEASTIIKNKDGSLSAKVICELCKCNVQDGDIASYGDAEKYAEENGIEYWDN